MAHNRLESTPLLESTPSPDHTISQLHYPSPNPTISQLHYPSPNPTISQLHYPSPNPTISKLHYPLPPRSAGKLPQSQSLPSFSIHENTTYRNGPPSSRSFNPYNENNKLPDAQSSIHESSLRVPVDSTLDNELKNIECINDNNLQEKYNSSNSEDCRLTINNKIEPDKDDNESVRALTTNSSHDSLASVRSNLEHVDGYLEDINVINSTCDNKEGNYEDFITESAHLCLTNEPSTSGNSPNKVAFRIEDDESADERCVIC